MSTEGLADPPVDGRELTPQELQLALERQPTFDSLLRSSSEAEVASAAKQIGRSARTVRYLLKRYRCSGRLVDLVPQRSPRSRGKRYLSAEVEAIIAEVIEKYHLSKMQPNLSQTAREIRRRCAAASIPLPAASTIRRRINAIPEIEIVSAREGAKVARYRLKAIEGKTPPTLRPLSRVQIDHTRADIVVVDDVHRMPLQRPWLTLAIDEYSRAILGIHLSLEAPSATSVGLCLVHAVLPKEAWASRFDTKIDWPMHGRPDEIYVDNGADFHSEAVERGCAAWGMKIRYRPPGQPHYGGIVERFFRTAMNSLRTLPGSTGRSIKDRGQRNPSHNAELTLFELEQFLARFFANEYHRSVHSTLGMSPLRKWNEGIFGTRDAPGCGPPMPINDPQRLLLDFLPLVRRKITRTGISWDRINYMDDVIKSYLKSGSSETFVVKRDPRDLSCIWLLSPEDQKYHQIRTRDLTSPSISLWELHEARKALSAAGRKDVDEIQIFRAVEEARGSVATATRKTSIAKKVRLAHQRRSQNATSQVPTLPVEKSTLREESLSDEFSELDVYEIEDVQWPSET